jgi:hypothetical protein
MLEHCKALLFLNLIIVDWIGQYMYTVKPVNSTIPWDKTPGGAIWRDGVIYRDITLRNANLVPNDMFAIHWFGAIY